MFCKTDGRRDQKKCTHDDIFKRKATGAVIECKVNGQKNRAIIVKSRKLPLFFSSIEIYIVNRLLKFFPNLFLVKILPEWHLILNKYFSEISPNYVECAPDENTTFSAVVPCVATESLMSKLLANNTFYWQKMTFNSNKEGNCSLSLCSALLHFANVTYFKYEILYTLMCCTCL